MIRKKSRLFSISGPGTILKPFAIIFDLELTAWEGALARDWTGPGEFREVVQIGAVKIDPFTLDETDSFNLLVRPERNPILSDYFIALTGINNEQIARHAISFSEALERFLAFRAEGPLWAYGPDANVLTENIALHGLEDQFAPISGFDITDWFRSAGLNLRGINSGKLAGFVGASWQGREHNGLDDARSIAAAVRTLVAKGAPNPFD